MLTSQFPPDYDYDCYSASSYSSKPYPKKSANNKSNKSSKYSSRKKSTDHDSKIKFKTEVKIQSFRPASTGGIKSNVPLAKM